MGRAHFITEQSDPLTTASYVVACTREIIRNAILNEQEYNRMTAILKESTRSLEENRRAFELYLTQCEMEQRNMLEGFHNTFDYNIETGENYDQAVYSIVRSANQAGIALRDIQFEDLALGSREEARVPASVCLALPASDLYPEGRRTGRFIKGAENGIYGGQAEKRPV